MIELRKTLPGPGPSVGGMGGLSVSGPGGGGVCGGGGVWGGGVGAPLGGTGVPSNTQNTCNMLVYESTNKQINKYNN